MKYSITQIVKRWLAYGLRGLQLMLCGRDFLLDLIFPRVGITRDLEKMGVDEALARLPLCGMIEDNIYAVFHYRHVLARRAIWELKYRGNKNVARLCAEILHKTVLTNFLKNKSADSEVATVTTLSGGFSARFSVPKTAPLPALSRTFAPILIPVPLTRARRRERGFNQNELVITEIMKIVDVAKLDGKNFVGEQKFSFSFDALVKTRDTAPQSSIKNRAERLKNLSGCFAVPCPELVRGKNIILIDDVATTGSTLKETRTALFSAGALSVCAVAIAH